MDTAHPAKRNNNISLAAKLQLNTFQLPELCIFFPDYKDAQLKPIFRRSGRYYRNLVAREGYKHYIHVTWIPAIPAGMTLLLKYLYNQAFFC
jgi:hypothetical protein